MTEYRPGELFVYVNGDRWELGQVKSKAQRSAYDAYYCWYSTGDTASCTPETHMHKLVNAGWSHVVRGGDDDWCEWRMVHSGPLYGRFQCSKCLYEHVENLTDRSTGLDPTFCPSCGRHVR